jgi:hypothetical protein
LLAASFAFALGISLALTPVETSARGGGFAGRAGVRAGGVTPHTFVRPINREFARPLRSHFDQHFNRHFNRHFERFSRHRNRGWVFPYDGYYGGYYGDYYSAAPSYYPPLQQVESYDAPPIYPPLHYPRSEHCDSQTVRVPSEGSGGYRSVNIVRYRASFGRSRA